MWCMDSYKFGSRQFWNKMSSILSNELSKKREPLDKDHILMFMQILAQRSLGDENTWTNLITDI